MYNAYITKTRVFGWNFVVSANRCVNGNVRSLVASSVEMTDSYSVDPTQSVIPNLGEDSQKVLEILPCVRMTNSRIMTTLGQHLYYY